MRLVQIAALAVVAFAALGSFWSGSGAFACEHDSWMKTNAVWDARDFELMQNHVLESISRDEVMKRAKSWVDAKIPYCQCQGGPASECCGSCPYCDKYRCDCSGFASYAWGLPYGYTTRTLPQVAEKISKDELLPGDIMLDVSEHVVIFVRWADESKTHYVCYQEPGCHTAGPHYAFESTVPYPFSWGTFVPYRYKAIA